MANPDVYEVDRITDHDGMHVVIGVDYENVTLRIGAPSVSLTFDQVEQLARAVVAATWRAAQYSGQE